VGGPTLAVVHPPDHDPLAEARAALLAGDEVTAERIGLELLALDAESPGAHEVLGGCRFLDDDLDVARSHLEHAFRGYRDVDPRAAARCAIVLAPILAAEQGRVAAAQGWLERARRQLEPVGPCVEVGYLELAVMACDRPDSADLLRSTERALVVAQEHGDTDLEVQALADGGLALVTMGRTREGFARLDAALAAISAGEVSAAVAGKCFCSMLSACDRAQDVRRATEWCDLVRSVVDRAGGRPMVLRTHCRAVYGSVLGASGRWPEAETLMIDALGPPDRPAATHRDLTMAHLAQLRLDQGRVEEAAELLAPYEDRLIVAAPLARVHLEHGDPDLAAEVARRTLRELVDDALRTVPLWALLVQAELARGDVPAAEAATGELAVVAERLDLAVPRAEAATAHARVALAGGDLDAALTWYAAAAQLLADGVRPALSTTVQLEVAEAQLAHGDRAAAVVSARAALAGAERLGAAAARDRAAALLRELGAVPARSGASTTLPDDLTDRERDVLALVAAGLTNAQIGERLYISAKTVEHHVGRILAKLGVRRRAEAAAIAVRSGLSTGGSGSG
jgi:DNA-binding NarL/FixJ family response regulator